MDNQNNRNFIAPYVYAEYPKWVTLADDSQILVHNAEEEAILTAPTVPGTDDAAQEAERQALITQAKDMGLVIHPKTSIDKLREKIAAAQE